MSRSNDSVAIDVIIYAETESGLKVSTDGERRSAVWLPKSQIGVDRKKGALATIRLPQWLAIEKDIA